MKPGKKKFMGTSKVSTKVFRLTTLFVVLLIAGFTIMPVMAETVNDIDARAERYYKEKRFSEAIREWLSALDIDPANERIQQKIEMVYEEKHKKNMAVQLAKIQMRDTTATYEKTLPDILEKKTNDAVNNFVIAYRIDPNDPELKALREKMEKFQRDMLAEVEKKRRSEADKRKYAEDVMLAKKAMSENKYEEARDLWDSALKIFKDDPVAKEGKRKAELAISNRLKYEKIKSLLTRGLELFDKKQYSDALTEYKQVLLIDPVNDEADTYITKIEDIIDSQQSLERKRQQAEQLYQAGLDDLSGNRFNEARDNFENALSLIPNYKDASARIQSIKKLRDDYNERLKRLKQAEIEKEFENGLLYFGDAKYKDALSSFERTLVLDPKNDLALSYLEKTKDALKVQQEEEVDETSPYYDIVRSLIISGRDLFNKGNYTASRERWEKILSLFPNNRISIEYILKCDLKLNPERFKNIAERVIQEGNDALGKKDYKRAESRFLMIKSMAPNYPDIDNLIAKTRKLSDKKRPGVAGTTIAPEEIERRYQLGIALYRTGGEANMKAASDHFRWITQNDPENMKALIALNKIESQRRTGSTVEADRPGARLTDAQRKLVSEYYFKGISYYSSNNYEKAIEEWRKVLAIDPGNEKAKSNIRKCLELIKR